MASTLISDFKNSGNEHGTTCQPKVILFWNFTEIIVSLWNRHLNEDDV